MVTNSDDAPETWQISATYLPPVVEYAIYPASETGLTALDRDWPAPYAAWTLGAVAFPSALIGAAHATAPSLITGIWPWLLIGAAVLVLVVASALWVRKALEINRWRRIHPAFFLTPRGDSACELRFTSAPGSRISIDGPSPLLTRHVRVSAQHQTRNIDTQIQMLPHTDARRTSPAHWPTLGKDGYHAGFAAVRSAQYRQAEARAAEAVRDWAIAAVEHQAHNTPPEEVDTRYASARDAVAELSETFEALFAEQKELRSDAVAQRRRVAAERAMVAIRSEGRRFG